MPDIRILLIEDNPALYELATDELAHHRVDIAPHEAAAFALLARERYDLVLLDLQLPRHATDLLPSLEIGFGLLRHIRSLSLHLPVIVMTAYETTSEITKRSLLGGATDYWNKDGSYKETLPEMVERVLLQHAALCLQTAETLQTKQYQLEFREGQVMIDNLVCFRKQAYHLLWQLRAQLVAARNKRTSLEYAQPMQLTEVLDIDRHYLRKIVSRARARIGAAYYAHYGVEPPAEAIIQTQRWEGYRLNPDQVIIIDPPPRG